MKGMARWNKVEQSSIIVVLLLTVSFSNLAFAQENTTENEIPPADTDSDGIADTTDQCINEAETMNGYQDEDGCPDVVPVQDTDNDGIADDSDGCPTQAETVNGFEDLDGCPDVIPLKDTDGDGITDSLDKCPTQTETMNGFEDSDGCPDTPPVNVIEGNQVEEKGADNSGLYQWAAVIAAGITAAGSIAAAKYRKHG